MLTRDTSDCRFLDDMAYNPASLVYETKLQLLHYVTFAESQKQQVRRFAWRIRTVKSSSPGTAWRLGQRRGYRASPWHNMWKAELGDTS
jgi:hypothetical protein